MLRLRLPQQLFRFHHMLSRGRSSAIFSLMVCVWCVFHTNRGNSAGRVGPSAGPFGAALKARSDTPEGYGAGVPQSSGRGRGAGRLDACELPLLRTYGYPLRPASPPGPAPGPVLMVCVNHNCAGSFANSLSPPFGSGLIAIPHASFWVRRRHSQDVCEE